MLCFKISINNELVCVAGVGLKNSLSVGIRRDADEAHAYIVAGGRIFDLGKSSQAVRGKKARGTVQAALFGTQNLNVNDKVTVELVNSDTPDEPVELHTELFGRRHASVERDLDLNRVQETLSAMLSRPSPTHDTQMKDFPNKGRPSKQGDPNLSEEPRLYCSFCGKGQGEVEKIIAGPQVFICNECVELCQEIVEEEQVTEEDTEEVQSPEPRGTWPRNRNTI